MGCAHAVPELMNTLQLHPEYHKPQQGAMPALHWMNGCTVCWRHATCITRESTVQLLWWRKLTQAYLNERLFISAASFSNFSVVHGESGIQGQTLYGDGLM